MWIRAGCAPQTLERNWKTIRDEALAVMDQKSGLFVPEEENLREKGEWGQYTLWQQGRSAPGSALDAVSVLAQQPCAAVCSHQFVSLHHQTVALTDFFLCDLGKKLATSCQGVPKTCALLERFSEATGCKRGQVGLPVVLPSWLVPRPSL